MNRFFKSSLALAAVLAAASCESFDLSGPKLDENPNIQTEALEPQQYFIGIHSAQALVQEGNVARTVCMWLQHCAGVDRQYSSYDIYSVDEGAHSPEWGFIYAQGGLKDIRNLMEMGVARLDKKVEGIAQIWEALAIGTAATVWGDVPYSEVLQEAIPSPKLDKQLDVYDALQLVLDKAIVNVQGAGLGISATADLVYQGNLTAWRQAAWTLKARYHMATAEVRGNTAYTAALAAAQNGIATSANDFTFYHSPNLTETNIWWQFQLVERDSYLRASATLVDTLIGRNDPRIGVTASDDLLDCGVASSGSNPARGKEWCAGYFDGRIGSRPGQNNLGAAANLSGTRFGGWDEYDGDYRQPVITWAENQLILAESEFRLGNVAAATVALNLVRVAAGNAPVVAATLREIQVQEWITMFQNIEVWNYWRRNCQPVLTPAPGRTAIPGRLVYPDVERNANTNVPEPSAQPLRNQNDPTAC